MPWVRLDDQFPDHPKIDQAGPLAGWLFVCGLAYCNRQLTDGFIPKATMPRLSTVPNPAKVARALVDAGLWDAVDGGWQVHDYLDFQPSRDKVLAERAAATARQQKRRSRRDTAVTPPEPRRESHDPDPTRPTPLTSDPSLTTSTGPDRDTDPVARIRSQRKGSPDAAKRALEAIRNPEPIPAPREASA